MPKLRPARVTAPFALLALATLLPACSSTRVGTRIPDPEAQPASASQGEGEGDDPAELSRKVAVQRKKLALARLEVEALRARQVSGIEAARVELSLAEHELATFREVDAPNRVASAQLDLRGTRDRAEEAAEELAQIELMYEDQDLDDRTAEYVVKRGRRNAERAAQRITLEEVGLTALEQRRLPAEETKLALAVERAKAAVRDAELDARIEADRKQLEVDELEHELGELEAKAREGAKP